VKIRASQPSSRPAVATRLFRLSPSRLALLYIVLSGLVLGLFAIPLEHP
jgi:hypothetical protein